MRACSAALDGGVLASEEATGVVSAILGSAVEMCLQEVFLRRLGFAADSGKQRWA